MCHKGNEGEQMGHFSVSSTQVGDLIGNHMVFQTLMEIRCSEDLKRRRKKEGKGNKISKCKNQHLG